MLRPIKNKEQYEEALERVTLMAENPAFAPIQLEANNQEYVWGVVVYNIHKL